MNDAAAIAIVGVLVAMLTGHGAQATLGAGLRELAWSFVGGVLCGVLAGRLLSDLLPRLAGLAMAKSALTLALPYPLYLLAEQALGVSGVVAVVCAGRFVLVSLLLNGTTLRSLIHRLGLDQLSPQERALQQQAIRRSTEEVEAMLARVADSFDLPPAAARDAAQHYRHGIELGSAEFDFNTTLSERDRFQAGVQPDCPGDTAGMASQPGTSAAARRSVRKPPGQARHAAGPPGFRKGLWYGYAKRPS